MPDLSTDSDTTRPDPAPTTAWCEPCAVYMTRRSPVLVPEIVRLANQRRQPPPIVAVRYLAKVHARHLAGLSLEVTA